jgi:predicted nucleic acid-binding protein
MIAATALERNLTVVTTDRDYERVPGLKVRRISLKRV